MKRAELIEWGIVTIGLVFGYKFFESIFTSLVQVFYYGFAGGGGDIATILLPSILISGAYAVCFILLIRKSRTIAIYLAGAVAGENVSLKIGKRSLLQVILIGICASIILVNIAQIILYLFDAFKSQAGRTRLLDGGGRIADKSVFAISALKTIIAAVTLYFSKDISYWFIKKNEVDELLLDTNPEN